MHLLNRKLNMDVEKITEKKGRTANSRLPQVTVTPLMRDRLSLIEGFPFIRAKLFIYLTSVHVGSEVR